MKKLITLSVILLTISTANCQYNPTPSDNLTFEEVDSIRREIFSAANSASFLAVVITSGILIDLSFIDFNTKGTNYFRNMTPIISVNIILHGYAIYKKEQSKRILADGSFLGGSQ